MRGRTQARPSASALCYLFAIILTLAWCLTYASPTLRGNLPLATALVTVGVARFALGEACRRREERVARARRRSWVRAARGSRGWGLEAGREGRAPGSAAAPGAPRGDERGDDGAEGAPAASASSAASLRGPSRGRSSFGIRALAAVSELAVRGRSALEAAAAELAGGSASRAPSGWDGWGDASGGWDEPAPPWTDPGSGGGTSAPSGRGPGGGDASAYPPGAHDGFSAAGDTFRFPWRDSVRSARVEAAWELLCGSIVQEFVYDVWYSALTPDREFPALVRALLNGAFGRAAERARRIEPRLVIEDAAALFESQLASWRSARERVARGLAGPTAGERGAPRGDWRGAERGADGGAGDARRAAPGAPGAGERAGAPGGPGRTPASAEPGASSLLKAARLSPAALERAVLRELQRAGQLHSAFATRDGHYRHIRLVSERALTRLVGPEILALPTSRAVCRELLAGAVFRPLLRYATPDLLNRVLLGALSRAGADAGAPGWGSDQPLKAAAEAASRGSRALLKDVLPPKAPSEATAPRAAAAARDLPSPSAGHALFARRLQEAARKEAMEVDHARPGGQPEAARGAGASERSPEPGRAERPPEPGQPAPSPPKTAPKSAPNLAPLTGAASIQAFPDPSGGSALSAVSARTFRDASGTTATSEAWTTLNPSTALFPDFGVLVPAGSGLARLPPAGGCEPPPWSRPRTPTPSAVGAIADHAFAASPAASEFSGSSAGLPYSASLGSLVRAPSVGDEGLPGRHEGELGGGRWPDAASPGSAPKEDDSHAHLLARAAAADELSARRAPARAGTRLDPGPSLRARVVSVEAVAGSLRASVSYAVEVRGGSQTWAISRPFSAFETLHRLLLAERAGFALRLPPRKAFDGLAKGDVAEARRACAIRISSLDAYLIAACADPYASASPHLAEFLTPGSLLHEPADGASGAVSAGGGDGGGGPNGGAPGGQSGTKDSSGIRKATKLFRGLGSDKEFKAFRTACGGRGLEGGAVLTLRDLLPDAARSAGGVTTSPGSTTDGGWAPGSPAAPGVGASPPGASRFASPRPTPFAALPSPGLGWAMWGGAPGGATAEDEPAASPAWTALGSPVGGPGSGARPSAPLAIPASPRGFEPAASPPSRQRLPRKSAVQRVAVATAQYSKRAVEASKGLWRRTAGVGGKEGADGPATAGSDSPDLSGGGEGGGAWGRGGGGDPPPPPPPATRPISRAGPPSAAGDGDAATEPSAAPRPAVASARAGTGDGRAPGAAQDPRQGVSGETARPAAYTAGPGGAAGDSAAGLAAPLYEVVDSLFRLRGRGFFRRQVLSVVKTALSMLVGDAVDELLSRKVEEIRSEAFIAASIEAIQRSLWPGGVWLGQDAVATGVASAVGVAAADGASDGRAGGGEGGGEGGNGAPRVSTGPSPAAGPDPGPGTVRLAGGKAVGGVPPLTTPHPTLHLPPPACLTAEGFLAQDSDEEGEADERRAVAERLRRLMHSRGPRVLVSLIGRDAYLAGVEDLFVTIQSEAFVLQLAYGLLDIFLSHMFPEEGGMW